MRYILFLLITSVTFGALPKGASGPLQPSSQQPSTTGPSGPANPAAQEPAPAPPKWEFKYHHTSTISLRRDKQKFTNYLEKQNIKDRNSMQLSLDSHFEYANVILYFRGNYGWLVSGSYHDVLYSNGILGPIFKKRFDLGSGYSADALGTLGVRLKIVDLANFDCSLLPSAGYKYSHLMNFPQGIKQYALSPVQPGFPNGTTAFSRMNVPDPNQQDWFGPFVEARVEFEFWDVLNWNIFYQYHWANLRSIWKQDVETFRFNPAPTVSLLEDLRISSLVETGNVHRQVAGTDIRYVGPTSWNCGIHLEGSGAWAKNANCKTKRATEQLVPTQLSVNIARTTEETDVLWISYEFSFFFGYEF